MRRLALGVFATMALGGCAIARPPLPAPADAPALANADRLLVAERIVVEIDWLPGCRPAEGTLDGIRWFLQEYAAPRHGVEVILDEEIADDTGGDWLRLERSHRLPAPGGAVAALHLLFVPRFASGELRERRGLAYPASGAAIIAYDRVREAAFLTVGGDEVERFVVQHELGHLLGLVSDARHQDAGHCIDPRCILYAGVDARALLANWWRVFTGRLPETLDSDCRRELLERRAQALARRSRCASETDASPTSVCAIATAASPRSESPTPPPDSAT
jgi:hypothetical protein